ncbi:15303_t:CDS:2 [Acaulospora morrowiae]|uniref:15303_t:CDS:1 n=1 Tax=Acaulospora morrowiae TaxID=94023 RepID=A0A9N8WGT3_9GLOM|nr:15303_t:CDS:2 [Acaulospora morrowiae]
MARPNQRKKLIPKVDEKHTFLLTGVINRFLVSTDGITGSEEYYYMEITESLPRRIVELSLPIFLDEAKCGKAEMCSSRNSRGYRSIPKSQNLRLSHSRALSFEDHMGVFIIKMEGKVF